MPWFTWAFFTLSLTLNDFFLLLVTGKKDYSY